MGDAVKKKAVAIHGYFRTRPPANQSPSCALKYPIRVQSGGTVGWEMTEGFSLASVHRCWGVGGVPLGGGYGWAALCEAGRIEVE